MDLSHIQQVSQTALPLFSQTEVERALDEMAAAITVECADQNPIILCVVIGGMVTFGQLITRIGFPLQVDYVHASRYRGGTCGHEVTWKAKPAVDLKNRNIIIVDDILDGGLTLKEIADFCVAEGAQSTKTAVLLDKTNCRLDNGLATADYTGLATDEDHYVFGYGLDYKTYLRNAPGIFAVEPSLLTTDNPAQKETLTTSNQ